MAASRWAAQYAADLEADLTRLAVVGDSSGGALAAVTALRCRDEGSTDHVNLLSRYDPRLFCDAGAAGTGAAGN